VVPSGYDGQVSTTQRRKRRLEPAEIRGMRPGQVLLLHRGGEPMITTLRPWWKVRRLRELVPAGVDSGTTP